MSATKFEIIIYLPSSFLNLRLENFKQDFFFPFCSKYRLSYIPRELSSFYILGFFAEFTVFQKNPVFPNKCNYTCSILLLGKEFIEKITHPMVLLKQNKQY